MSNPRPEQSRVLIWHERRALRYRQLQDVHGHQRYRHLIRRHQEVVDAIRQLMDEIARLRRTEWSSGCNNNTDGVLHVPTLQVNQVPGASSRSPLEGFADAVTVETERQAGRTAWEPQGVETTSQPADEKGAGDAEYGAMQPDCDPDEARQKVKALSTNSTDAPGDITTRAETAEARCTAQAEEIARLKAERDARIEPLVQSDDPEVAEAMRLAPDYVLMTRRAYEMDSSVGKRQARAYTLQQVREMIEEQIRAFLAQERTDQANGDDDAGQGYPPFHLQKLLAQLAALQDAPEETPHE